MRSKSFQILTVLFLLAGGLCAPAKDFPTIGKNPGITVGSLPDNVSYYLAENDITKGYANFILVQKSFSDVDHSRGLLLDLPHFKEMAPYEFLASKGVGYGQGGYVSYPDGNTVFSFEDVPTYDSAASDSTLLLIFDLVKAFDGEQAIIICGDIAPKDMESRLHVFSLTVGPRTGHAKNGSRWTARDSYIPRTTPPIWRRFPAPGVLQGRRRTVLTPRSRWSAICSPESWSISSARG